MNDQDLFGMEFIKVPLRRLDFKIESNNSSPQLGGLRSLRFRGIRWKIPILIIFFFLILPLFVVSIISTFK